MGQTISVISTYIGMSYYFFMHSLSLCFTEIIHSHMTYFRTDILRARFYISSEDSTDLHENRELTQRAAATHVDRGAAHYSDNDLM